MSRSNALQYWYAALASPYGIELVCSDITRAQNALYSARKEVQDEDLMKVSICHSPFDPARLWLVKRVPDET